MDNTAGVFINVISFHVFLNLKNYNLMKKLCVLFLLAVPFVLQFCSSSKNAAKATPKLTYTSNVQPLMVANCSPCHFPPRGNKKAFDNYIAVKGNIDSLINRVNRNPTDKGFMPFKHSKLADSTINVFVKWKSDGMLEN